MARITVEDCTQKIPNRFELVVLAARRAAQIAERKEELNKFGESVKHKNTVYSLREIAENEVDTDDIKQSLVKKYQKYSESDTQTESMDLGQMLIDQTQALANAVLEPEKKDS